MFTVPVQCQPVVNMRSTARTLNTFHLLCAIAAFIFDLGLNKAVVASSKHQGLDSTQSDMLLNGKPDYYLQLSSGDVSEECQQDLYELLTHNSSGDTLLALDAFGKPGSGILVGDLIWLGTYEECQELERYHYCLVDLQANISDVIPPEQRNNFPEVLPVRWGTCFPESCNEKDVLGGIDQFFGQFNVPFPATPSMVQCSDPVNKWTDGVFVFTVVLCGILACLMLGGYGLDVYLRPKSPKVPEAIANGCLPTTPTKHRNDINVCSQSNEESPLLKVKQDGELKQSTQSLLCRLLLCFALNRNLTKLLDTHQSDRNILCLNGIRALSMFWVILGHVFVVIIYTQSIDNMVSFAPLVQQFGFQAVLSAPFAVDTFFLLSGLLVTMGCINRLEKNNGRIPWLWFYFHRYWRLTPTLAFIILLTMSQQHLGEGPVWFPIMKSTATQCKDYWWTTILYINNFYPSFGYSCVGHSWYLANDMQFFVISPIFILLLYKFKKIGLASIMITCLVSFSATAALMVHYGFDVSGQFAGLVGGATGTANLGRDGGYTSKVYNKPYCRIPVYLVGMVMGLIIQRHLNRRIRLSKVHVTICWLVATVLALAVVYGLYPAISQGRGLSATANAFYASLSRFVWGIAVSWVIFACYFGYAGPINHFLSWKGWVPVSRLTYTAYLIHLSVIYQFYQEHKVPWHLSVLDYSYYFVAIVGMAYGIAVVLSLAIEYPFANMEKLFLPNTLQSNRGKTHTIDEREKNTKETDNTNV